MSKDEVVSASSLGSDSLCLYLASPTRTNLGLLDVVLLLWLVPILPQAGVLTK